MLWALLGSPPPNHRREKHRCLLFQHNCYKTRSSAKSLPFPPCIVCCIRCRLNRPNDGEIIDHRRTPITCQLAQCSDRTTAAHGGAEKVTLNSPTTCHTVKKAHAESALHTSCCLGAYPVFKMLHSALIWSGLGVMNQKYDTYISEESPDVLCIHLLDQQM